MPYGPAELGIQQSEQRPYGQTAADLEATRAKRTAAISSAPARPTGPAPAAAPPAASANEGPPMEEPPRDTPPGGQEMFGHPGGIDEADMERFRRTYYPQSRPRRVPSQGLAWVRDFLTGKVFSQEVENIRGGPVGEFAREHPVPPNPTDLLADATYRSPGGASGADAMRGLQRGGSQEGGDEAEQRAAAQADEHHRRAWREMASLVTMGEAQSPQIAMSSVRRLTSIVQRLRAIGAHADADAAMAEIAEITQGVAPKGIATREDLHALEDIIGTKQAAGYYAGRETEQAADAFKLKGLREGVERREAEQAAFDTVPGEAPVFKKPAEGAATPKRGMGGVSVGGGRRLEQVEGGGFRVTDRSGKTLAEGATADDAMAKLAGGGEAPPVRPPGEPPEGGRPPGEPPPSGPPAPRGDQPPAVPQGEPNLGINLDLVRSQHGAPDHLIELLRTEALAHIDEITTQRRGVQSIETIFAKARNLGIDVPALAQIRPGTAFNAEGAVAILNAIVRTAEKRLALEEQIRAAGALATPEQEGRWLAAVYDQNTLQRIFAGGRAEAGRTMRALRELATGANSGQIKDTFSRALDAIGGRANFDKLLQRLKDIQTNPTLSPLEREIAAVKLIGSVGKSPRFWDKINEIFINSILSNPLTHQANSFGQAVLFEADALSQLPAAVFDAAVSVGGVRRPRTRTMQSALIQAAAGHMALRRALAEGLLYMRHGVAAEDVEKFRESGVFRGGTSVQDVRIGGRNVAPIGTLINLPTRALGAEDVLFNRLGYQRQLWQDAANYVLRDKGEHLFSRTTRLRIADVAEHPEDFQFEGSSIADRASEAGRRAGLRQDAGELSKLLTQVRDVEVPRSGGFQPGRYITPFVRIGFNLARVGAEYSPLGFVRVGTQRGGTQADAFGRAVVGSSLWWFFWSKADQADLTGAAPSDPREKAEFYDQGKRPYSIKVGDHWIEYSRYEPIASTLKWVHGMHEAAKDVQDGVHDPGLFVSALLKASGTLARSLTDSSYLSGLQDFYSILTSSDAGWPNKVERFAGNLANSVIPYSGLRRFIAQQMDPVLRHPTSFLEQIEAATPTMSGGVKPYLTRYGESVARPDRPAGIVTSAEQVDPVDTELAAAHGKSKISVDGQEIDPAHIFASLPQQDIAGFKLSKDEGFLLQQTAGRTTHKFLTDLFADRRLGKGEDGTPKRYSVMTPRERSAAIGTAISDARRTARATVADAILESATDDGQVMRGAVMRLATLSKVSERADFLAGLRARGKLSPAVRDFLNRHRRLGERTVEEYLRAAGGGRLPTTSR